jgi:hypothetical protein
MFVGDGDRCERRPEWRIGSVAELDYAYLCGKHLDFVRQPGQLAEVIEQPGSGAGWSAAASTSRPTRGPVER